MSPAKNADNANAVQLCRKTSMNQDPSAQTSPGLGITLGVLAIAATVGIFLLTRRKQDGTSVFEDVVGACERAAERLERSLLAESA